MVGKLKPLDVERETRPGKYADGDCRLQKQGGIVLSNRHAGLSRTPSTASLARLLMGPVLAGESGHSIG